MRNKLLVALTVLSVSLGASAQQQQSADSQQPAAGSQSDKNIVMVADDLHALSRVVGVADDINRSRQILLAILDSDIDTLRMPRGDGTYKWASLQREEGGRVKDEKSIEYVYTEKELRNVLVTGANGYRVEVTVPRKRNVVAANNRVWV